MAPILASRAGMLLSQLPPPTKPNLVEEAEKKMKISEPDLLLSQQAVDLEANLKSPRNSFFEDFSELCNGQPMKPDRLTHEGYISQLEARLKEVHRAPKKLSVDVKWRRFVDFPGED
eukprot:Skav235344  [mRNA]  locus=scaffold520:1154796:1157502:+ [translate_table: standard]